VTYLGWKIIEIPMQALSYGLSSDYSQRARVQGWRGMAQIAGQFLFFLVPFVALQFGISDSTELDFRSLGMAAVICAIALPLATVLLVLSVPGGKVVKDAVSEKAARYGLRDAVRALRTNPPLLRLFAAFLPVNLLAGMSGGLSYLYIDTYLGLGAELPAILAIALLMSIVGIPFWTALSARFERHRVWAYALVIGGVACAAFALVEPGPFAVVACFILLPVITLVLSGSVVVYTMSADIVDYGKLRTGQDHGGLYGSMFAFLQKSFLGVSAALGLALVGAFGFDATAETQTPLAAFGVKAGFSLAPALGLILAAIIIWNYPLNRARIAKIQAALTRRSEASLGKAAEQVTFGIAPAPANPAMPEAPAATETLPPQRKEDG
jgi:glycoside/pentoside/hexuronide:cation symporter, GPH family